MADSVGQIGLDLVVNENGFNKQMNGLQRTAKKAGMALASAFGAKKLADFGKKCIELGSDLTEVQNVVDVTFPTINKRINEFAKNAASKFGLSETMAKRYSGTLGSMAEAFGFSEKAAADMATTLTGLAGDVASFYNISQDEAYTKLKSVFTGETESLKELGVVMTQAALDQYALANGFGKTTQKMTEAEKVSLRYAFVQDQLANATGDFARTSDSWANQVRILSLQFDSLRATIGQGLINVFAPLLKLINRVISRLQVAAKVFSEFTAVLMGNTASGMDTVAKSANEMGDGIDAASTAASGIGKGMGSAAKAVKVADKAAKSLKRTLEGFDQIIKLSEKESTSGKKPASGSGKDTGTSIGGGLPEAVPGSGTQVDDVSGKYSGLLKVLAPLAASLGRLKSSFSNLSKEVGSVFKGIWEKVLKPFGKWTISELAPRLVDILAAAFNVLASVINALKPPAKWLWDNFLAPIAKFTGDAVTKFLDLLIKGLDGLAVWINNHQDLVQAFAGGIAAAFAVLQAVKIPALIQGVIRSVMPMGKIFTKASGIFTKFSGVISFLTSPLGIAVVAIGAVVAAGILLYKNWDKVKVFAKKLWKSLAKTFKSIKENVIQNVDKIISKVKEIPKKIKDFFKGRIEDVKEWFGGIKDSFNETLKKLTDNLPDLSGVATAVSDAIGEVKAKIVAWFQDKKEDLKKKWDDLTADVSDKTASLRAKAATKSDDVKKWWEDVCSWWKDKAASLAAKAVTAAQTVKGWWDDTVSYWKDKTASLRAKAETAVDTVKQWWSNRSSQWKNKSASFKVKCETKADKVRAAWNAAQKMWKDKSATFKLNFNAKVSDFKAWANKNIIDKINGKFKNIPILNKIKIPHLAEGGFVKKNTPQLAMIGDNRHQGEIVAPEKKLQDMAREAAGANNNQRVIELLEQIVQLLIQILAKDTDFYIDGEILTRKILSVINSIRVRSGKNPVVL